MHTTYIYIYIYTIIYDLHSAFMFKSSNPKLGHKRSFIPFQSKHPHTSYTFRNMDPVYIYLYIYILHIQYIYIYIYYILHNIIYCIYIYSLEGFYLVCWFPMISHDFPLAPGRSEEWASAPTRVVKRRAQRGRNDVSAPAETAMGRSNQDVRIKFKDIWQLR